MARHRAVEEDSPFRILFVCTGNICRSPFAEILTRHLLVGRLGGRAAANYDVTSAGVRAVAGAGMHPDSRAQLAPWGLDRETATRFVARQLHPAMALRSDLILGATLRHRSAVVEGAPGALPITFSLREFARLVADVDPADLPWETPDRARALVEVARHRRGLVPPSPDGDDIPDPMGKPVAAHHDAAAAISTAVLTVLDVLAPRTQPTRPMPVVRPEADANIR